MFTAVPTRAAAKPKATSEPRTLAVDIGGTHLKAMVLGPKGEILTDKARVATPRPATPKALIAHLTRLNAPLGAFDRVSVGFPGVVVEGVIRTAPNLHNTWKDFPLAQALADAWGRPVRVLNDAGVQGFGVIEGRGVEMVITLGTGMGCALYIDGRYVPNLELAHHPLRHHKTYEDYVGDKALKKIGKRKWKRHVQRVIEQIEPIWNPRKLYLGGGNSRLIDFELPPHVVVTENIAGLLGGIVLWRDDWRA